MMTHVKFLIRILESNSKQQCWSQVYMIIVCIHTFKGRITITGEGAGEVGIVKDERNKQVFFKTSVSVTDCISEITNTQVDIATNLAVLMPMHL